ncbi:hypothetical protein PHISCL_03525 [Aspergillus sclerotialis]|uniref:Uncharacterized protein n=1 Tax=Aspergillus sclerotialis TaxID=2070753 RepID=A0A3A3A476_9EURO|nr:hypothetical protein PHISCL_03525 [Aspergillus sclerotialis]
MCHGITWYHAICLHPNSTPLFHIACERALKTGDYCYSWESISIPMVGACEKCKCRKRLEKDDHYVVGREAFFEQVDEENDYEMADEGSEVEYLVDDEDGNGDGLEVFHRVAF